MISKEEVKQSIIKLAEYCTERQQKYSHDFCKGCEMEDVCFIAFNWMQMPENERA